MKQVYYSDVATTPPSLPATAKEGYPQDGTVTGNAQATVPGAYWFHMVSSELENAIRAGGKTPDASKVNQLGEIIGNMHAAMNAVSYLPQTLTDAQKRQAKENLNLSLINVRDFGAKGDGVTDDAAAFNAAANSVSHSGGTSDNPVRTAIIVPPGTYLLNSDPIEIGSYENTRWQIYWFFVPGARLTGSGRLIKNVISNYPVREDWYRRWQIDEGGRTATAVPWAGINYQNGRDPNDIKGICASIQSRYSNKNQAFTALHGAAVNNCEADGVTTTAWGLYAEATRMNAAQGTVFGAEIDPVNAGEFVEVTPYLWQRGASVGIQIAAGAEYKLSGLEDCSAAIQIDGRPDPGNGVTQYGVGINIRGKALRGIRDDNSGTGIAIAMGRGHQIAWYAPSGAKATGITSYVSTPSKAASIEFYDGYTRFATPNGYSALTMFHDSASDTGLLVDCRPGGVLLQPRSTSNTGALDLRLKGIQGGRVRFGTYTASALTPTGYITIRDENGTDRRLLVG